MKKKFIQYYIINPIFTHDYNYYLSNNNNESFFLWLKGINLINSFKDATLIGVFIFICINYSTEKFHKYELSEKLFLNSKKNLTVLERNIDILLEKNLIILV